MKRIAKIYNYIEENSKSFDRKKLFTQKGFSTEKISTDLNILRNNVSKELNILCREKKIVKIKNRPVLYFDRTAFENLLSLHLPDNLTEIKDINLFISTLKNKKNDKSPFNYLIGYNTSLKNQIEQAKAAIMYPPSGLHTLIIGSTGVGKSLFANIMYQYAKYIKKLSNDAPFIVFNCADYANTPQLLLSHIFGHIKGAFTGADSETNGIVAKADGGILFLDEIHRLPPEGQEMIFYFMDTGTYNKLGENDRTRKANVLLICATTEDPSSALLNTFIRRIPITIAIPNFDERPLKDQLKLLHFLISKEAKRVNKPVKISSDAIKALIGSTSYGNVGQLKSNIQFACAKGFLNSINNNAFIDITLEMLPDNIQNGIIAFSNKEKNNSDIWNIIPNTLTIKPYSSDDFASNDSYEPSFNIYNIIKDKSSALQEQGMNDDDIKKFITTDINLHLKQFYDRYKEDTCNRTGLLKIVDKDIVSFAEEIKQKAEKKLNKKLTERFIYAVSLHFSALFNRLKNKNTKFESYINIPIAKSSVEYEIAKDIHYMIEKKYNLIIPPVEIDYLALLLSSIQEPIHPEHIGILVAAHGNSTASSMVAVAKKLFEYKNIAAIDMPLEMTPSDVFENILEKVKEVNDGNGVLLLVDMGSLNILSHAITEKTHILTKSIDMVSTPLVLEAVRKCSLLDTDLNSVYSYLLKDFRGYTNTVPSKSNTNDVIVTICSTGKGTAIKLKDLVEDIISSVAKNIITVIPIGLKNLSKSILKIQETHNIIAIVGVKNPNMNIPFISIEDLIDGSGESILKNIINGDLLSENINNKNKIVLNNLCQKTLSETLTFLNPAKIYSLLEKFISSLEESLNIHYENPTKLRLMLHVACAIERMVIHDGLIFKNSVDTLDKDKLNALKKASYVFKNALSITLSNDELYYMVDIIDNL